MGSAGVSLFFFDFRVLIYSFFDKYCFHLYKVEIIYISILDYAGGSLLIKMVVY